MSTSNRNRNRKGNKKPKAATTSKGFDASKDSTSSLSTAPRRRQGAPGQAGQGPRACPVVADERFSAEQNELRALVGAWPPPPTRRPPPRRRGAAEAAANMGVAALGAAEITEMSRPRPCSPPRTRSCARPACRRRAPAAKLGAPCVGALMAIVPTVLALTGDKKGPHVRAAAATATLAIFDVLPNEAVPVYIQECILKKKTGGLAALARPETKVTSLKLLSAAAKKAPREVEGMMTTLVPVVSKAMWDVKKVVKEQAEETLEDICGSIDNIDITPFIPNLVDAIADPETVPDCIYSLAGTTFVQTVTASALSITVPLLKRGFNDKKTAIKRKCAVITENMAKLVKNPAEVASPCRSSSHCSPRALGDRRPGGRALHRRRGGPQPRRHQGQRGRAQEARGEGHDRGLQAAMTANGASASVKSAGRHALRAGGMFWQRQQNFLKVTGEKALTALLAPCFVEGEAAAALVDARVACATMVGENTAGGESESTRPRARD